MSSLPFENQKSASLICHLRKDVQGIVRALKTDFPELRIKEYHGKSDPVEKAHDFSNVEESWKDIDLVAYTSTLKIGVSCTNPKFERAFCLFNSYIKTNAGTNQMLFRMRCIKDYICHIEQRSSNVPITEEGIFRWLLSYIFKPFAVFNSIFNLLDITLLDFNSINRNKFQTFFLV